MVFYTIKLSKIIKYGVIGSLLFLVVTFVFGAFFVYWRYPLLYVDTIEQYAAENDLPPALVCAIIHTESRFDINAQSHKGASGLMQLTEQTATWIADEMGIENFTYDMVYDPDIAIPIGCYYMRLLMDQFGNKETALAAYNAGSGNVSKWLADSRYSPDGVVLTEIPYPETENFVKRVERSEKVYTQLLKLYHRREGDIGDV